MLKITRSTLYELWMAIGTYLHDDPSITEEEHLRATKIIHKYFKIEGWE